MTTRPYELLVRFKNDGTVAGAYVKNILNVGGKDYETDPIPIAETTDTAYIDFASAFSSSVLAERDSLAISLQDAQNLIQEKNSTIENLNSTISEIESNRTELQNNNALLTTQLEESRQKEKDLGFSDDIKRAEIERLQAELDLAKSDLNEALARIDELENPPIVEWRVAPNDFIKRFTPQELIATQMSIDPIVILGRTDIQTIITYIDLKDPQTQMYINRLVQLEILTQERADQILTY